MLILQRLFAAIFVAAVVALSLNAKGLARYAQEETKFARIQLIRKIKDSSGTEKFKRLDFGKGEIRDKVLRAQTLEELNNIFDADGFVDCPKSLT